MGACSSCSSLTTLASNWSSRSRIADPILCSLGLWCLRDERHWLLTWRLFKWALLSGHLFDKMLLWASS